MKTDDRAIRVRVLRRRRGLVPLDVEQLWRYRDLLIQLAWRSIVVRYKQSLFGLLWALINPLVNMAVFTLVFGRVARLPSQGAPYEVLILAALVPWQYASGVFTRGTASLVGAGNIIQKVYFPRLILPLSTVVAELVDFTIAFLLLLVVMPLYGVSYGPLLLLTPLFFLLAALAGLAPALWLGTLNVKYRDVGQVAPVLVRIGMFVTPVMYDAAIVPERWRLLYRLNPMVGVVDGFRWCVLGPAFEPHWPSLAASAGLALIAFVGGLYYLRYYEKSFADVV